MKILRMLFLAPTLLTQALAQTPAKLDPERARQGLEDYVRIWSSDREVNEASVEKYYAPVVSYYGKRMSRSQVLADKLRYIRTYPRRFYEVAKDSVIVSCDAAGRICRTSGLMKIRLEDRMGRALTRTSSLRLVISAESGGQIIIESANDTGRR